MSELKAIIKRARETAIRLQAEQVAGRAQYTADIDQAIADDVTAYFERTIAAWLRGQYMIDGIIEMPATELAAAIEAGAYREDSDAG